VTRHRLSRHFTVEEFDCHDGTKVQPRDYNGLAYLCRTYLEPLRAKYGPVKVHSGFRTRRYNASVGGASNSFHIYTIHDGNDQAADVSCARGGPRQWHATLSAIRRRKRAGKGGLGLYVNFVHVDIRDYQANWKGKGI
jgi:zinc D-Ala-D-Ala carboxypeptidase